MNEYNNNQGKCMPTLISQCLMIVKSVLRQRTVVKRTTRSISYQPNNSSYRIYKMINYVQGQNGNSKSLPDITLVSSLSLSNNESISLVCHPEIWKEGQSGDESKMYLEKIDMLSKEFPICHQVRKAEVNKEDYDDLDIDENVRPVKTEYLDTSQKNMNKLNKNANVNINSNNGFNGDHVRNNGNGQKSTKGKEVTSNSNSNSNSNKASAKKKKQCGSNEKANNILMQQQRMIIGNNEPIIYDNNNHQQLMSQNHVNIPNAYLSHNTNCNNNQINYNNNTITTIPPMNNILPVYQNQILPPSQFNFPNQLPQFQQPTQFIQPQYFPQTQYPMTIPSFPIQPEQRRTPVKSSNSIPSPSKEDFKKIIPDNIIIGKDKRTTLMLRHIPNKYTLANVVDEINTTFWGKFDYVNLPIDYRRKLNLGYAFVNFVDPLHIILFYTMYHNKKWSKYHSDKKMDMSYADKQGKKDINCKDEQTYYAIEDKRFNFTQLNPKLEIPAIHHDFFKKIHPNSVCVFDDKNDLYGEKCFIVKHLGKK